MRHIRGRVSRRRRPRAAARAARASAHLDLKLVLRLRLGRLERAGEDAHLRVGDVLRHLLVRDLLVHDDAAHQHRVLQLAAHLAVQLRHSTRRTAAGGGAVVRRAARAPRTGPGTLLRPLSLSLRHTHAHTHGRARTLMRSRLTSCRSKSATASTASTAISAMGRWHRLTILDESVVIAVCTSASLSSSVCEWLYAESASRSIATLAARSKPSAMRMGWMPRSRRISACSRSAPASTTTPVVPSPISLSCERDRSTSSLAIWWLTCICSRIVAPSFEMVTSPSGLESILSMPFGPSDVRITLHTDLAAWYPRARVRARARVSGRRGKGGGGARARARAGAVRGAHLDVGLLRVETLHAVLPPLLAHDDERPPILVEHEAHGAPRDDALLTGTCCALAVRAAGATPTPEC